MVSVKSSQWTSKSPFVNVEIGGINELNRKLLALGQMVENNMEEQLMLNANLEQQEVQESIIGNRSEPKSVDTGKFGNSIEVDLSALKQGEVRVFSNDDPGKVAALEYGTTTREPRQHFQNTLARTQDTIIENFKQATGKAVKVSFATK